MAMAYPSTLPAPLLEGHSISAGQDTIRTDMETGAARQRRRSFSSPDRVNLAWVFNSTQFAVFRAWYDGEINGGGAWFTLPIDDGVLGYATPRDVRFVESFEASKLGSQMWRVSVKAEIRRQRLSAFDHLNLLGLPSLDLDFAGTKSLSPVITSARQSTPSITFTRASTATYVDADGLIKTAAINAPRFDHDPVSLACKGLLIEESRANLISYSSQFDHSSWVKVAVTVTSNSSISPDGSISAATVTVSATGDTFLAHAASSAATLCHSVFIKSGGGNPSARVCMRVITFGSSTEDDPLFFDFATKSFSGATGNVLSYGYSNFPGGWVRVWAVNSAATGQTGSELRIRPDDSGVAVVGKTVLIWGAQTEAGSFPTSYIPTTTAAVTRAADSAVMTGGNFSSWYRQDEGAFICQYSVSSDSALSLFPGAFGANSGGSDRINLYSRTLDDKSGWGITAGGVVQSDFVGGGISYGQQTKSAIGYKVNDSAGASGGALISADSACVIPSVSRLDIGCLAAGLGILNGHVSRLTYYPKRLSNAQLQAMTV